MCWNKEVSFSSFLLISVISYGLYIRNLPNDRMMAIFIMIYGSMQLIETIIWIGLEYNNININKLGTILVAVLLYLHPLGLILGINYDTFYSKVIKGKLYKIFFIITTLLFISGLIHIVYSVINKKNKFISHIKSSSSHIVWDKPKYLEIQYNIGVLLVFLSIIVFVYPKNNPFGIFLLLYFIITGIYSLTIASKEPTYSIFGSYWCWIVSIWAFLIYIINPLLQNYNN